MTAAMLKYHLNKDSKFCGINIVKKYMKKIGFYMLILSGIIVIYLEYKVLVLSQYKDLADSKTEQLNEELKLLPHFEESLDSWKTPNIEESRIFSAYLDTRPEVVLNEDPSLIYSDSSWAIIRIIAIIPVNLQSSPLTCYYKYENLSKYGGTYLAKKSSIRTQLVAFKENFGMYYSAAYILCPLPLPERDLSTWKIKLPHAVTVSFARTEIRDFVNDNEFVIIRYPKLGFNEYSNKSKLFSVCVQPFHHKFNKAMDLIVFIEYYKLMGVDRFTFYRDSVTQNVDLILNYYKNTGLAEVIQWQLPDFYVFERSLRVDGIYAALNDCLYRSTFHIGYKYVAGIDIDEYIVPRMHENFTQMMKYLEMNGSNVGGWIFRNVFYYLMYEDDDSVTQAPGVPRFNFHVKTKRWEKVNPSHDRSKFIVRGHDIVELGNHRIWEMKRMWSIFGRRYKEIEVNPDIGTSNHYRTCETTEETCWRRKMIIDRIAHRFTEKLGENVAIVVKKIFPHQIVDEIIQ